VRFGIAYKLVLVVLLTVLVLGGSLGAFFVAEQGRSLRAELDLRVAARGAPLDDADLALLHLKQRQLVERTIAGVVAGALLAALIGVGLVRLLLRRALSPALDALRGIGVGDLSRRIPADPREDEVGEIGHAFNLMADRLSSSLVSRAELEETVARRTRELSQALDQQRRTQLTLEEREARIRLLLDSTAEAIFGLDRDGLCTFCNQACARLLGYRSPEELVGRNMHQLIHHSTPDGAEVHEEDCRIYRTLRSHERYHSEDELFWRTDGTPLAVEVWSHPMLREGELVGSVVTFLDLSVRKRLEAELLNMRKLESLGVLAGGIAHDFNNLLMGILGNVALAKEEIVAPGERAALLSEAEQAALRARHLTQQLLTFSKGGTPVRKVVALRPIVEEAARFALSGAAARADFSFPAEGWPIEADAGQIGQVVHNLILNAVQAMPTGGNIDVACENVTLADGQVVPLPAGRYLQLRVRDQGHGIPPEHLHRIFDPYFTTKSGGHGLGLASVYSIVQHHGGQVTVDSTLGKGSTFTVYLPATDRTSMAPEPPRAPRRPSGGRVLVMDDEPAVRRVATVMLERLGYDVEAAAEGAEALEKARAARAAGRPFDVLLLDLTVPGGMGGVEAAERLQFADPEAVAVATSGYSSDPVMARWGDFGFVAAIAKPYAPADLAAAIAEAIASKRRS
jgi:two-component system cell cycle sensor histidine kinase/response regulator CckA